MRPKRITVVVINHQSTVCNTAFWELFILTDCFSYSTATHWFMGPLTLTRFMYIIGTVYRAYRPREWPMCELSMKPIHGLQMGLISVQIGGLEQRGLTQCINQWRWRPFRSEDLDPVLSVLDDLYSSCHPICLRRQNLSCWFRPQILQGCEPLCLQFKSSLTFWWEIFFLPTKFCSGSVRARTLKNSTRSVYRKLVAVVDS